MTEAERDAIRHILGDTQLPIIAELGAWQGEDFEGILGRQVVHIMAEPDPRNVKKIVDQNHAREKWIFQVAIGNRTGYRVFHPTDGDHGSGSVLRPTGHLAHFPHIHFEEPIEVACLTLDLFLEAAAVHHIDLLWVDIQGAEAEMIEGGTNALSRTRYLFMEAEEIEFYEGQKIRTELLKMLPAWELLDTFDYNVLLVNKEYRG